MRWWAALPLLALAAGATALAEPGNPISVAAAYHAQTIRGYTCGNWGFLSRDSRTDYLLGVISLADTLWASDMLDYATEQAVRLPLSAADYRTLVDAACVYLPAGTKVIAVLYAVK